MHNRNYLFSYLTRKRGNRLKKLSYLYEGTSNNVSCKVLEFLLLLLLLKLWRWR